MEKLIATVKELREENYIKSDAEEILFVSGYAQALENNGLPVPPAIILCAMSGRPVSSL